MKKTTLLTAILVTAIGLTCFTACGKTGKKPSEPEETRKPKGTAVTVVDETKPDSENNDDEDIPTDQHNREALAKALHIKENDWQIDGMLQKLEKIGAGKIRDLEFDPDDVTLYFKGEDGTEYKFFFTNKDNLNVMACRNLTSGEMEFASYQ